MKPQTLGVAVACCIGVIALALFLFSGCYLGQAGTSQLLELDAGPELLELDAGPELLELDAGPELLELDAGPELLELDAGPELLELDAGPELLELDGCLPWELALPSSCPRGAP